MPTLPHHTNRRNEKKNVFIRFSLEEQNRMYTIKPAAKHISGCENFPNERDRNIMCIIVGMVFILFNFFLSLLLLLLDWRTAAVRTTAEALNRFSRWK